MMKISVDQAALVLLVLMVLSALDTQNVGTSLRTRLGVGAWIHLLTTMTHWRKLTLLAVAFTMMVVTEASTVLTPLCLHQTQAGIETEKNVTTNGKQNYSILY